MINASERYNAVLKNYWNTVTNIYTGFNGRIIYKCTEGKKV